MKVSELIAVLKTAPENAEIYFKNPSESAAEDEQYLGIDVINVQHNDAISVVFAFEPTT